MKDTNRQKVTLIKDLETSKAGSVITVWDYVAAQLQKSGHIKNTTGEQEAKPLPTESPKKA